MGLAVDDRAAGDAGVVGDVLDVVGLAVSGRVFCGFMGIVTLVRERGKKDGEGVRTLERQYCSHVTGALLDGVVFGGVVGMRGSKGDGETVGGWIGQTIGQLVPSSF